MPLGTKFSTARKRLTSQLGSALRTPLVRRSILHRGLRIPRVSPFAAYFADSTEGAYQLEQWLPAFQRLALAGTPVSLLVTNASMANRLLKTSALPVWLCPGSADVEDFIDQHDVQVIFYVNNNQTNFTTLRVNGPVHVHLSHGESEKASMVSNQLKAYDLVFIAGPASRERIMSHVWGIDPTRLIEIGRPQLDAPYHAAREDPAQIAVLYAPTWEGDSPAMAYSSIAESGQELVRLLATDERVRLVFRPHPKTGTRSLKHLEALRNLDRLISRSAALAGQSRKALTTNHDALADIRLAEVVVTDVSAMAMDAVGMSKPTLVLTTSAGAATGTTSHLLSAVPTWSHIPSDAVQQILNLAARGPDLRQREFREYVFGADELGTGTDRFIRAAQKILGTRLQVDR